MALTTDGVVLPEDKMAFNATTRRRSGSWTPADPNPCVWETPACCSFTCGGGGVDGGSRRMEESARPAIPPLSSLHQAAATAPLAAFLLPHRPEVYRCSSMRAAAPSFSFRLCPRLPALSLQRPCRLSSAPRSGRSRHTAVAPSVPLSCSSPSMRARRVWSTSAGLLHALEE
ncbi:hypothetical protein ZWY2020_046046 [Hordeum vulgare]|nr:hypothetical protein ZWY2020_046046 [Hordeum vulgare]